HPFLRGSLDVDVLLWRHFVRDREVVGEPLSRRGRVWGSFVVDQLAISEQLERENIHLLLRLATRDDQVTEIVVRDRWLDASRGIVGQRQRNRARRRDRGVMREARTGFGEVVHELRSNL